MVLKVTQTQIKTNTEKKIPEFSVFPEDPSSWFLYMCVYRELSFGVGHKTITGPVRGQRIFQGRHVGR